MIQHQRFRFAAAKAVVFVLLATLSIESGTPLSGMAQVPIVPDAIPDTTAQTTTDPNFTTFPSIDPPATFASLPVTPTFPPADTTVTGGITNTVFPPADTSSTFPPVTDPTAFNPAPSFPSFPSTVTTPTTSYGLATSTIPYNPQSGDYFDSQSQADLARWEQLPVKVYISFPDKFPQATKDTLTWAIGQWKQYVPMEVTTQPSQAQISVEWSDELDKYEFGKTRYKEIQPGTNGRNQLVKVQVKLAPPARFKGMPEKAMRGAYLHELGHALGIRSGSDVEDDAMCEPSVSSNRNKIIRLAVTSLALKGLQAALSTQGIDVTLGATSTQTIQPTMRVSEVISQRDLNTLYKLYNPIPPVQNAQMLP